MNINRKTTVSILFLLSLLFVYAASVGANNDKQHLQDTLSTDLAHISKVEISDFGGNCRITSNRAKIKELTDYLNRVTYDRLLNDQTAYMPMNTRIIYLYEDDKTDFIIFYEKEAMINQKVYQVKGEIAQAFLADFYHSLPEP